MSSRNSSTDTTPIAEYRGGFARRRSKTARDYARLSLEVAAIGPQSSRGPDPLGAVAALKQDERGANVHPAGARQDKVAQQPAAHPSRAQRNSAIPAVIPSSAVYNKPVGHQPCTSASNSRKLRMRPTRESASGPSTTRQHDSLAVADPAGEEDDTLLDEGVHEPGVIIPAVSLRARPRRDCGFNGVSGLTRRP